MNDEQKKLVQAAKERADKATLGPWSVYSAKVGTFMGNEVSVDATNGEEGSWVSAIITQGYWISLDGDVTLPDAEFIASARQDIPALIAIIEEQEAAHQAERKLWEASR